jgi:superfamily II RNA helicase
MPRVKELSNLLPRGIGFHNAGMLPVLKILVEDLFEQRLLKALFATETFAVGINMPARTVVFENLKKFDGRSLRMLHSREYFQMAGRAGRRGIDDFGHAISLFRPDDCAPGEIKNVLDEEGTEALQSQFDLSYNSVLNLATIGSLKKIEEVLKNNFYQYQFDRQAVKWKKRLKKLKKRARERFQCRTDAATFEELLSFQGDLKRFPQPYEQRANRRQGRKRKGRNRSDKHIKRSPLSGYACFQCSLRNRCTRKIKWFVSEILSLQETLSTYSDRHHVRGFWKKVKFLQKLGYLDELTLTDRGIFASHIHGYELQITELAMGGLFKQLSEPELVACLACVIHEPRGEERLLRMPRSQNLRDRLAAAFTTIRHLRKQEKKHGLTAVPPMQPSVAKITFDWATGSGLMGLVRGSGFSEGDFIRLLRLVIDLLRQIKAASHGFASLQEKVDRCMTRVNRELVRPDLELGL